MDVILAILLAVYAVPAMALLYWWLQLDGPRWWDVQALSERRGAERRAKALLTEVLTVDERLQLERRGYLEIPSPSTPNRVCRIPKHPGRVRVYEAGKLVMKLCIGPASSLPGGDTLLVHKLMIEGNEAEYLQIANRL